MELKELREKTLADLDKLLRQSREKLRALKFSVSAKQLKNIKEVNQIRKLIAKILTIIKEKEQGSANRQPNPSAE